MTLEDFHDSLDSIYKEYMGSLKTANDEFRAALESLLADASKTVDAKYSGAIMEMLDEKTKELNAFAESVEGCDE